ncbi:phage head closure protein [Pedomonas sp. V897]|uniref:phage head closure protein n=1 Tax=Pedomonas sp. V897 TaxID=3446482 RepID=UPI003EE0270A
MADLIGALDRRLRLLRQNQAQNPVNGDVTVQWVPVATVWASRRQLSGREVEFAAATRGAEELRFRIRYRPDVSTTGRVECEGVPYEIVRVEEIGRRRWLDIYARRV